MFDWNDLRHFLAVSRTGSTLAAAAMLKVNQTTVARRIAALEQALGARLFEKAQSGYRPTELALELLPLAEQVETEAATILRLVEQRARRLSGKIRVTTNETIAAVFLTPSLPEFAALYPDICVEIVVDARHYDLGRGEADVALRAAPDPGSGPIAVRKLRDVPWGIYCSRDYAALKGRPDAVESLAAHTIIGADGPLTEMAPFQWLEAVAGPAHVIVRSNSLPNMLTAIQAGLGLAALPCAMAEPLPDLVRCIGPVEHLGTPLWLITRADSRDEPRIRAFTSYISARIVAMRHLFELGDDAPAAMPVADPSALLI